MVVVFQKNAGTINYLDIFGCILFKHFFFRYNYFVNLFLVYVVPLQNKGLLFTLILVCSQLGRANNYLKKIWVVIALKLLVYSYVLLELQRHKHTVQQSLSIK